MGLTPFFFAGARRCEIWFNRLSIRPSKPSSSYRSICRRNVLSQTPNRRAASSCVKRLCCHPSYASSNLIFRVSCSHSVRFIQYLLRYSETGQFMCYKPGHFIYSQQWFPPDVAGVVNLPYHFDGFEDLTRLIPGYFDWRITLSGIRPCMNGDKCETNKCSL